MYRVSRHYDPSSFLKAARPVLGRDPITSNVIGSVATGVAAGRRYDSHWWCTVADDAGQVVGLAIRTAPHFMVVSDMPPGAAAAAAGWVTEHDPDLPGVTGPEQVAGVVADRILAARPSADATTRFREFARVLGELRAPAQPAPGHPRPVATDSDRDTELAAEWLREFEREAGLLPLSAPAVLRAEIRAGRDLWFWEYDGAVVAIGGHAPIVDTPAGTVARIGPMFTPERLRGQGYATALTHRIAADLASRVAVVMLYADVANRVANHIYAALGFQVAAEIVELEFSEKALD